jgi:hypothetical protein
MNDAFSGQHVFLDVTHKLLKKKRWVPNVECV